VPSTTSKHLGEAQRVECQDEHILRDAKVDIQVAMSRQGRFTVTFELLMPLPVVCKLTGEAPSSLPALLHSLQKMHMRQARAVSTSLNWQSLWAHFTCTASLVRLAIVRHGRSSCAPVKISIRRYEYSLM
jgi:hypothetical protein